MSAETTTYDLSAIRDALPALRDVTYMNSGTEGIMAEPVVRAYVDALTRFERYGHWARQEMADEASRCRERVARLINAGIDEVTVTRNGADGCAFVLGSFPFQPGDELLIGNEEHPAITHPAFVLQTFRGITVRRFRFEHDPEGTLRNFVAALSPKTRLAAFSHVSCETGIRVPAVQMVAAAAANNTRVLLDCAQTFGAMPLDFPALGADFLTGSAHKWLCGPKGTGMLAIRRDRLDGMVPAYVGTGSLAGELPHDLMDRCEEVRVRLAPTAARFEYGMRNPAVYVGLSAAIDYLNAIGWEQIAAHERRMSDRLKQRLADIPGVRVQTPTEWEHSSAIVNFSVDGVPGRDLSKALWDDYRIVQRAVRQPNGVRISNAYFVSDDDHDRLISAVQEIGRRTR